jgi:hypothetical protein
MSQRKAVETKGGGTKMGKTRVEKLSPGQRAYEERRAQRAGMSLEAWLAAKEARGAEPSRGGASPAAEPGFFARLWRRLKRK